MIFWQNAPFIDSRIRQIPVEKLNRNLLLLRQRHNGFRRRFTTPQQSDCANPAGRPARLWELVRPRRGLLALSFVLMVINRVAGLVLPYSTRFLIDTVIAKRHIELLTRLVLLVLLATATQGVTSFALTQLLSKAAQRLIADLRRKVQSHIGRLPVAFYDSNKTGTLVSRIMSDVEGVRNLLGTGWWTLPEDSSPRPSLWWSCFASAPV